ncbi:MAG: GNAT family N-acetyltransferase [Acidobacteria bacterium]|nr:GNAT family N-acetyltransferase [Acidobacteriota bacterium]
MRAWERNAANLSASLSFYGPAEIRGGVKLINSAVSYSVFNIALLTDPVSDLDGELERRIQLAAGHYGRLGKQWSFWVCEHLLSPRTASRLTRAFPAWGMQCIAESPGMELDELAPPRRPLPDLSYRRVSDSDTRADFAHLVANCFHIPTDISHRIYGEEGAWSGPLEVWLGYSGGCAVASTAVIAAAGAVGIYSVATQPGFRGKGLAEAVMRHAIAQMRQRGEHGPLVLQSSPSGLELYRRLGFRRNTRYWVFSTE